MTPDSTHRLFKLGRLMARAASHGIDTDLVMVTQPRDTWDASWWVTADEFAQWVDFLQPAEVFTDSHSEFFVSDVATGIQSVRVAVFTQPRGAVA